MKKPLSSETAGALAALGNLARYKTHGGYVWAAVTEDGALLCVPCVRDNYRLIRTSTRDEAADGWQVIAITHSGESDGAEQCDHCSRELWSAPE